MKIAVIILNYNSSGDCRKCINFLKQQEEVVQEVVIVDNCSRDDDRNTVEALCKEKGYTFIANHENRGYSAGNNIGLRYAAAHGYEYALIANPDIEFPQTDYLSLMLQKMEEDQTIAVCGSDIVTPSGAHQNPMREVTYIEELLWPFTIIKYRNEKQWYVYDYEKSGYCEKVSGCCFMIRISFLQKIGFLDESTFLYCEEPILAKQVQQFGEHIYYLADVCAVHRHIKSEKGNSKQRMRIFYRSRSYYLTNYSGYSRYKLALLSFSRKLQFLIGQIFIK